MKTLLKALFVAFLTVTVCVSAATPLPTPSKEIKLFQKPQFPVGNPRNTVIAFKVLTPIPTKGVSILSITEPEYSTYSGSGIVIAPNYIITAGHLFDHGAEMKDLKITVGRDYEHMGNHQAIVIKIDKVRDLALVYAPAVGCPCAPFAMAPPTIDEDVFAIGYPMGLDFDTQTKTTGTYQGINPHGELIATVTVAPGSSGGGMFNKHGSLIGVVMGMPSMGGTGHNDGIPLGMFSLSIPLGYVLTFIKDTPVEHTITVKD